MGCGGDNEGGIDGPALVFGGLGGDTEGWEGWAEEGDESGGDGSAEGRADGESTVVGHPVACLVS